MPKADPIPKEAAQAIARYDADATAALTAFLKEVEAKPPPDVIYQYTNDVGLRGILQSGTLWFSDVFRLNDPSELRHGLRMAIELLRARASVARPEIETFVSQFERFDIDAGIEHAGHFFICCFSGDGDDLGQWRAYGDDGRGFALGFDTKELEKPFVMKGSKPNANHSTFGITYNDAELRRLLASLTNGIDPLLNLPRVVPMRGKVLTDYMGQLLVFHSLQVIRTTMFFKHEAYRNEKEYRFQQLFRYDKPAPKVKVRHRPYAMVRYREFDWRKKAAGSLKKIVIGPAADRAKARRFVDDCLREFHTPSHKVAIEFSAIPYRPS